MTLVVRFDLQKQQYAAKYIGEIIHITLVSLDGKKNVDQMSYNYLKFVFCLKTTTVCHIPLFK